MAEALINFSYIFIAMQLVFEEELLKTKSLFDFVQENPN